MTKAAVLTISDSVAAGTRTDRSGPAVRERLEQLGWSVPVLEVIPDEADQISARLAKLADGGRVSAIFTTGGTGVAPRDITPEATRAVLDREIPS
jgi:molybdopterin adenylyltransferase